jgi:succinyl-diaminopimelate desuccinylase
MPRGAASMGNEVVVSSESDLLDYLEQRRGEIVQLLCELIAIPTPNPPGDNYTNFCNFAASWLEKAGLEVMVYAPPADALPDLLPPESYGQRYAVLGRLQGTADHPGFCLQGHYDTVGPSHDWKSDPYVPRLCDDVVYGLGSSDMKGGLASMMMAAKALVECRVRPEGTLFFLATPDEEFASRAGLAHFLEKGIVDPDYAVVGEPSGVDNIYIGMKGGIWGDVTVRGRASHGSQPFAGVNAFDKMVDVANAVRNDLLPSLHQRVSGYDFQPREAKRPTMVLGGMVGGTNAARSMVPDKCTVSFDRRIIPEETLESVEAELMSFFRDLQREDDLLSLEVEVTFKAPPMVVPADARVCSVVSDAITEVRGMTPTCTVSCGGFETILFVDRGVQAVTYGPGVEGCAHAAEEYTLVSDLAVAAKVYALAAYRILA